MKRTFLLAALWVWLCGALSAQNHSLDAIMRGYLSDLDKSTLETGILLQQAPIWVNPAHYGKSLNDTNDVNPSTFGRLYGQLRAAAVNNALLPAPDIYLDEINRLKQHPGDTVSLAMLMMRYNYIRSDAFEKGLLQMGNNKVTDVPGRTSSPYGCDTTFAMMVLNQSLSGNTFVFKVPSHLVFSNVTNANQLFEANFDDGQGWQRLQRDECITVRYTSAGQKSIALRWYDGQRFLQTHSKVVIAESNVADRYAGTPDEVVFVNGSKLNFFFDCEDHKLRKPLIVVEGFGGELVDYRKMINLLDISPTGYSGTLKDWLDAQGYDLIWVDWINSNASIQDNAASLQSALEYINNRKHNDGSAESNAMIGASMGGLVGKYCLLKMHNVQHKDSEVERFFTYDSPLKGANYPVGLQLLVRDLISVSGSFGADPSINGILQMLDGPAATQMLRQKVTSLLTLSSQGFDMFQADINALENIAPLTSITRHIAISNGAGNNTGQETVTANVMANLDLQLDGIGTPNPPYWQYEVFASAKAYLANNSNTLLYERTITIDPLIGPDTVIQVSYTHPAPLGLDVCPGGTSNIALDTMDILINQVISDLPNWVFSFFHINNSHFSFVPTVSAFDMPVTTSLFTSSPVSTASRSLASNDNSVTSVHSGLPEYNQYHVSMNVKIADLLVDELGPHANAYPAGSSITASQIYNFGKGANTTTNAGPTSTPKEIINDLIIESNAAVWVNRSGKIGFTSNNSNPQNFHNQWFGVMIPGAHCDPAQQVVVTIAKGGNIKVGEYGNNINNKAGLFVNDNGTLDLYGKVDIDPYSRLGIDGGLVTVNQGAEINLAANALLNIEDKGTLHIKSGGILRLDGANSVVNVRESGTLILEPGAIVHLNNSDSRIFIQGKMVVNGNIAFGGFGYFDFAGSANQLELGPNANAFVLNGMGKGNRFVKVTTQLDIPASKGLALQNGAVEQQAVITLGENGWVECRSTDFTSTLAHNSLIADKTPGNISMEECDFSGFENTITLIGRKANNVLTAFTRCNFNRYQTNGTALFCRERRNVVVNECLFDQTINGGTAAVFEHNYNTTVANSKFICGRDNATIFTNLYKAISLAGGWTFRMIGGEIIGFTVGISNDDTDGLSYGGDPAPTNILLSDWATIRDGVDGIRMQGDNVTGVVGMNCARIMSMDDNCITGRDITLMIDPFIWAQKDGTPPRPNTFTVTREQNAGSTLNRYVNVCYLMKTPPNPTPMKYNFWGLDDGNGNMDVDNDPKLRIFLGFGSGPGCSVVAASPSLDPLYGEDMPVSCETASCSYRGNCYDECLVLHYLGFETSTIKDVFLDGIDDLNNGLEGNAKDKFEGVASHWDTDLGDFTNICQTIIQAGKSLANGDGQERPGNDRNTKSGSTLMRAMPNPATDQLMVNLSMANGISRVQIFDGQGRLMLERQANATQLQFDVSEWTPGVYLVRGVGSNNTEIVKVVVEH